MDVPFIKTRNLEMQLKKSAFESAGIKFINFSIHFLEIEDLENEYTSSLKSRLFSYLTACFKEIQENPRLAQEPQEDSTSNYN